MNVLKTAQLQTLVRADTDETLRAAETAVAAAADRGADLVALPEMFCCPYEAKNFPLYAEPQGGRVWNACAELAAKYGVWLSAGSVPESDGGRVYNTAYVFDRTGAQAAKHRKAHLFDIDVRGGQRFRESETLTAGDGITVFQTEFCAIGLCVCYDFRFPELARLMVDRGARVLLVPAAFNMTTGPAHWELLFRSRAVDNQVFALGTAPARDESASYRSWGHTVAVSPWGDVLGELDEREGCLLSALELDRVEQVREQLPLLRHRRTDLYCLSASDGI